MDVVGNVRVEIASGTLNRHFTQKPGAGELVKGVVYRGQRYSRPRVRSLCMQGLRAYMSVSAGKQEFSKGKPLPGWSQPCLAKFFQYWGIVQVVQLPPQRFTFIWRAF